MTTPGKSFKIGGEGGDAFPFDKVGDSVTGTIVSVEEVQQTDMDTNAPAFWDDGGKKLMNKVTLQTELRQIAGDTGLRSVFLRGAKKSGCGSSLAAVIDAIVAAGGTNELEFGGVLTLTFTGEGPQAKRGYNKPKLYSAVYAHPTMIVGGTETPPPHAPPPPPSAPPAAPALPRITTPTQPSYVPPVSAPTPAPPLTPVQLAGLQAAGIDISTLIPKPPPPPPTTQFSPEQLAALAASGLDISALVPA